MEETIVIRSGYMATKVPDHPLANRQGYVLDHRRVAWEHWGPFDPALHVHHINGNKWDNRIANLQLLTAQEHGSIHGGRYDFDAIAVDYLAGATTVELGKKYGIDAGYASRALRRRGVPMRPQGAPKGYKRSEESVLAQRDPRWKEMARRYEAGESAQDIANSLGVHLTTVLRSARRAGVSIRPVGRPPRSP